MAVDTRQVSAASDSVVSRGIQRKSECGLTIVPTLAAASQTASEVVLPTAISVRTVVSDKSMKIDTPDTVESGMEMAGGSPPAEVDISVGPDVLLTAISVMMVVSEKSG